MALKISLKPHERLIIGGAVVVNGNVRSDLIIENNVPILRIKDIMRGQDADTPCKRVYLTVQLMYVDEKNLDKYRNIYWKLVRDILTAAPSMLETIKQISDHVLNDRYYRALKVARKLINLEEEILKHASKTN